MAASISMEDFRALVVRAGLELADDELAALKPMYEHYLPAIERMNGLDLDDGDLAVAFAPGWDSEEALR